MCIAHHSTIDMEPSFLTSSCNIVYPFVDLHTTRDAKAGIMGVCSPGRCDRYRICHGVDHILKEILVHFSSSARFTHVRGCKLHHRETHLSVSIFDGALT